jgi:hypothetical protein
MTFFSFSWGVVPGIIFLALWWIDLIILVAPVPSVVALHGSR